MRWRWCGRGVRNGVPASADAAQDSREGAMGGEPGLFWVIKYLLQMHITCAMLVLKNSVADVIFNEW